MTIDASPQWEEWYRCHGFWIGTVRWGRVSIGPRGHWKPSDGYLWEFTPYNPNNPQVKGWSKYLRQAKFAVERAYRLHTKG